MHLLTKAALNKIAIVILVAVFVIVGGIYSTTQLKSELLPNIDLPLVTVVTVYPGAAPDDVLRDVTKPIEQAVSGSASLKTVSSTSNDNISIVSLSYEYGTDMDKAQQHVQELVNRLTLPQQAQRPTVGRFSFNDIPLAIYSLNTSEAGPDALSNLRRRAQDTILPELKAVPGVNSVVISGGETKQVVITLDAKKMADRRVTASQITGVLQANNISFPSGTIVTGGQSMPVVVAHEFTSADDISKIVVGTQATPAPPKPVHLSDVASVVFGNTSVSSISRSNGKASLSLIVFKTQNTNTVQASHAVDDKLNSLKASLPGTEIVPILNQASYIEDSLNSLIREGVLGAILAILVILLFLRSVRSTLVTAVSIPVSILIAFSLLNIFNISLNIMSLAGLAVAVGRVVDDSIVVLENIFRHVRNGEPVRQAAYTGTREVASAITSSTLTTVSVFLPLGFLAGFTSEIFRPFAIAVALALLASLLVALTVVPVLASLFITAVGPEKIRKAATADDDGEPAGVRKPSVAGDTFVQRIYTPILTAVLRNGWTKAGTLLAAVVLLIVSLLPLATGGIGFTFLNLGSDKVQSANIKLAPGTDIHTTSDLVAGIEDKLSKNNAVSNYQTTIGANTDQAASGIGSLGSDSASDLTINLKPDADLDKQADWLRGLIKATPKVVDYTVTIGTNNGFTGNGFALTVTGPKTDDIAKVSNTLVDKLRTVPDLVNVESDLAQAKQEIRIIVDPDKAGRHGSTAIQVAGQVRGLLTQQKITSITLAGNSYDVVVGYDPATMNSIDDIRNIKVGAANPVALSEIADVSTANSAVSISRIDQQLAVTINGTITSKSTSGVTTAANSIVAGLALPAGVKVATAGVVQQQSESFSQLGTALVIAVGLVYLVMVLFFGSLSTPFVIMFSLPLAAIGSFLALWVTGRPFGISAMIGILMLVGIVVTNAIVLLDMVEQHKRLGYNTHDSLIYGGRIRVRPILMTAIATIIALIPLAVSNEGALIAAELGTVVIGGLFTSTMLTLVVVPVVYSLLDSLRSRLGARFAPAHVEAGPVAAPGNGIAHEPELVGGRN